MNMMNLRFSVAYMLIIGGLTNYYIMPNVMLNDVTNIRNSLGKFYLAGVMAFIMAILEVLMFDIHNKTITVSYYIPLFACTSAPIRLEIQLVDSAVKCLSALTSVTAMKITNCEYVANMIELSDQAMGMIQSSLKISIYQCKYLILILDQVQDLSKY
jgi:hypothetical protein